MQRDRATFLGKPVAGDRALIMAIVNRTPDSFYDRGATFTDEAAKEAARLLGWGRNTLTRKLKELDIP